MMEPPSDHEHAPPPSSTNRELLREVLRTKDTAMASTEARDEELRAYHEGRVSRRVYRTFCQFRFGYLSFLVLMIILMFSFTLLMEIFFAIFLPSARTFSTEYIIRSVLLLVLLPFIIFFLSYFFEEATRFFTDSINRIDGGLPNFRLALAVVIHYLRHRKSIRAAAAALAERERGNNQDTEDDDEDSRAAGLLRSSLFLSAKDDPFTDVDKEEEDLQWAELESLHAESTTAAAAAATPTRARQRWNRATGAIRVALLMRQTHHDERTIDFTTLLIVDFFCPVLFEIVTLVAFVSKLCTSWSPYEAFNAYVRYGFWSMFVYLALWMVTHFWSSRNQHMRRIVSNYRRRRRVLRGEIRTVQREKQSTHLWLLDVGFRFYHHVAVAINPLTWVKRNWPGSNRANHESANHVETSTAATGTPYTQHDPENLAIDVADGTNGSDPSPPPSRPAQPTRSFALRAERLRDARAWARAKNPWHTYSDTRRAVILLLVGIVTAVISMASFSLGWPLMGICMIMLSTVIQRRFPQIFGNTFRYFVMSFVVLSLVFFSSTYIIGTFVHGGEFKLGPFVNTTSTTTTTTRTTTMHRSIEYPVCSIDYDGLTIVDLALMADAAYGRTPEIQQEALANRLNGTDLADWTFVNHSTTKEHRVWMEVYFPQLNMTVVAIRGTASAADALEDLHFWFGITIMQALDVFVPFLQQLPRDFVVNLLAMRTIAKAMPPPAYTPLVDHVASVKARVGDRLVVTGHSLGGAMAAIVGAKTHTPAVSFSGPGLMYSRGRFGIEEQDVRDYVLTLKPQRDVVPMVDELGGMVQELRCREKSPMACHKTKTHMCELYEACGDVRGRNWGTNPECLRYQSLMVEHER